MFANVPADYLELGSFADRADCLSPHTVGVWHAELSVIRLHDGAELLEL